MARSVQLRPARFAGYRPASRFGLPLLAACAIATVAIWLGAETVLGGFTHPASIEMQRASQTMQAATQIIRTEKQRLGLMQPLDIDPNRTGLIGSEYTEITTSMGMLDAKRTATNPDLAAAIVRTIADMDPQPKGTAVVLVSGSILGADIAAIAAIESLGLEPLLISSVGASMFGATDPDFTWLDIEALLLRNGVVKARSSVAVIGGGGATGGGLSSEGRDMIRASAARNDIALLEEDSVDQLLERLEELIAEHGPVGVLINAGGSVAALGTCIDGDLLPAGLISKPAPCTDGVRGLIVRMLDAGVPVLHLLNMRSLAAEWNLPYDPIPLPIPGNNKLIYGAGPSMPAAANS